MQKNIQEVILKIENFCAYRERCSFEVMQKLKRLGASENDIPKIVDSLLQSGFLSDDRFLKNFIEGKVRIKKWGLTKIKYELSKKGFTAQQVDKAFNQITLNDKIDENLTELSLKKWKEIQKKDTDFFKTKAKLIRYLLGKGYDYSSIIEATSNLPRINK
jgi:regulatory protein